MFPDLVSEYPSATTGAAYVTLRDDNIPSVNYWVPGPGLYFFTRKSLYICASLCRFILV